MGRYFETEAVLLTYKNRGEADRILTFYTKELGRIDVYGKSIRSGESKLKGHGALFNNSRIMLVSGRNTWRLVDIETSPGAHSSTPGFSFSECAEFLLKLTPPEEQNEKLWGIVSSAGQMNEGERVYLFKARVLEALGMLPDEATLPLFFTPRAAAFLKGESTGQFLTSGEEARKFNYGVERILSENHMI